MMSYSSQRHGLLESAGKVVVTQQEGYEEVSEYNVNQHKGKSYNQNVFIRQDDPHQRRLQNASFLHSLNRQIEEKKKDRQIALLREQQEEALFQQRFEKQSREIERQNQIRRHQAGSFMRVGQMARTPVTMGSPEQSPEEKRTMHGHDFISQSHLHSMSRQTYQGSPINNNNSLVLPPQSHSPQEQIHEIKTVQKQMLLEIKSLQKQLAEQKRKNSARRQTHHRQQNIYEIDWAGLDKQYLDIIRGHGLNKNKSDGVIQHLPNNTLSQQNNHSYYNQVNLSESNNHDSQKEINQPFKHFSFKTEYREKEEEEEKYEEKEKEKKEEEEEEKEEMVEKEEMEEKEMEKMIVKTQINQKQQKEEKKEEKVDEKVKQQKVEIKKEHQQEAVVEPLEEEKSHIEENIREWKEENEQEISEEIDEERGGEEEEIKEEIKPEYEIKPLQRLLPNNRSTQEVALTFPPTNKECLAVLSPVESTLPKTTHLQSSPQDDPLAKELQEIDSLIDRKGGEAVNKKFEHNLFDKYPSKSTRKSVQRRNKFSKVS